MIGFNVAPFTGKEFDYIREAISAEHILSLIHISVLHNNHIP